MIRLGCTVRIIRIIRIIRIADGLPSPGPVVNICLGFSWDALAGSSWDSLQGALEGFSREILQLQPFPFSGGKGGGRHGGRQREGGGRGKEGSLGILAGFLFGTLRRSARIMQIKSFLEMKILFVAGILTGFFGRGGGERGGGRGVRGR